jgi:molecular chaperone DnaK
VNSAQIERVPGREVVLGIDFGTSTSSAAAFFENEVHVVLDGGDPIIPSVVYVPRTGDPVFGMEALRHGAADPFGLLTGLKRVLGRRADDPAIKHLDAGVAYRIVAGNGVHALLRARGSDFAPIQLVAGVLTRLRRLAEVRFGGAIRRAVLTVPVEKAPEYTNALRRAAGIAGLEVLAFVPEPVAAVVAHGYDRPGDRRIAVCDFGGGTFDATLMEQHGVRFQGVASAGDPFLGGDDLDVALADGVDATVYKAARVSLRRDVTIWSQLLLRVESAKRQLSQAQSARLRMRDAYTTGERRHDLDLLLDRAWAEPRWKPLTERATGVVSRLLDVARWRNADIDEVVLVGGTTLVPMVQHELAVLFQRQLTPSPTAHLAVVRGAALLAARHAPVELSRAG